MPSRLAAFIPAVALLLATSGLRAAPPTPTDFEPAPEAEPVFDRPGAAPEVEPPAPPGKDAAADGAPTSAERPAGAPTHATTISEASPPREPLWLDPAVPELAPGVAQACPERALPVVSELAPSSPADADPSADWLHLDSGEWLKGSITRMREGQLDFSSVSVGNQTLAWDRILELRSTRQLIYVLKDRSTRTGPATLKNGRLNVVQGDTTWTIAQDRVLSIVPEKTLELSKWSFRASLSLGARSGNTQSFDFISFARLSRVDAFSRVFTEYNGAFGVVSGTANTSKHRGNGAWDLFVSPAFYLTPVSGEATYDRFQNLALRWTAASGFGARTVRLASLTLKTDLAFGYLQNNYASVQAGQPQTTEGAFARPGLQINGAILDNVSFEVQWQSSVVFTNLPYTFHHGVARLSVALGGVVTLDANTVYDRQETTVTGADGVTPKRDDIALGVGLGIDLH